MKLYIKYMVCLRCMLFVKSELEKLRLTCMDVDHGSVEIKEEVSEAKLVVLNGTLSEWGLEILDGADCNLVEKIECIIIEMIHYSEEVPEVDISDYIAQKLNRDYTYLSNTFSKVKGTSIEHYIKLQKIEKIKELLKYGDLTLSEIARKLRYSSVAELSTQFKKISGLTPSYYMNSAIIKKEVRACDPRIRFMKLL